MSYNLYVWEQPAGQPQPATLEEASAMVRALERAGLRPGGNLVSFVGDLPPELSAVAPDDSPLLVLGVPEADRLRSIRRTVDAARGRRLTVFDDQLGLVFLPTGSVLPQDQAHLWKAVVEQLDAVPPPLAKGEVQRLLRKEVAEILGPHGFRSVPDSKFHVEFVRPVTGGAQWVHFWLTGSGAELRCGVSFTVAHDKVAEIYDSICGKDFPGGGEWSMFFKLPELLGEDDARFLVTSTSEIQALAATILRVALPRLDEWREIADVDRVVHRGTLFPNMRQRYVNLIIAWLAGNPDFERLAEAFRAAKATQGDEYRDVLERLLAYLRQLPAG